MPKNFARGYYVSPKSGTMAAGLAADSPVFSLRWNPTDSDLKFLLRTLHIGVASLGTGFTAGLATFELFRARPFTVSDSGGTAITLSGGQGKLDSRQAASQVADARIASTATLTAGTRTLDSIAFERIYQSVTNGVNTAFMTEAVLVAPNPDEPLILNANEGLVLQATVPATGTWQLFLSLVWAELMGI